MRNSRNGWEKDAHDPDLHEFETECALMEIEASATNPDNIYVIDPETLRALAAGGLADGGIISPVEPPSLFAMPKSHLLH